jgi:hypothetical protein
MKKYVLVIIILCASVSIKVFSQTVVVTDDPVYTTGDASAVMEIKSSNGGFLPPRMTQAQRLAVSSPAQGLLVYQTDGTSGLYQYDGSAWSMLTDTENLWSENGSDIYYSAGKVGIGTSTPEASAVMEVNSTNGGFLPPRMTQAQRLAVSSPAQGLLVYQTDGTAGLYQYDGSAWSMLTDNENLWSENGSDIYFNTGNIGVGTTTPSSTMTLSGSFSLPLTTQASTYTIASTDYTVLCNAGSMTINLPSAATAAGRVYVIKKISSTAGTITIDPSSTETIDGALTNIELVNQWSSIMIQSDGINWLILSKIL